MGQDINVNLDMDVDVNVKRAPTDESISLLNEFTKKAKDNIIHTVHIQENYLKAIAIYYKDEILSNRTHFHLKFNLNGKEYLIEDSVDNWEWRNIELKKWNGLGNEVIFKALHKKFSEIIAEELMKNCPDFIDEVLKRNGRIFQ